MSDRKLFGTDGIRGKVGGLVINPDMMLKLGYAFGLTLHEQSVVKPCVLMGRDTRISGELLEASLQAGLLAAGVDVVLLGILPTPAIAHFTKVFDATAGIVISASHNPYQDNGVKIIAKNGLKLSDQHEKNIEEKMQSITSIAQHDVLGTVTTISDAEDQYVEHCVRLFEDLSLANFQCVVDCANGATFHIAEKIFAALNAKMTVIHANPDGFNINEKCGATHLQSLKEHVLASKAEFGIAFDGDGDRLMMVDHLGEVVDGDEILCMLAMDETKKYDAVVGTLMSNLGLEQAIKSHGMEFVRVAVGDRYVLEKLLEKNWVLGGEGSGHIVNLAYAKTGDGVLTALQVLKIMQHQKKSLHELKQVMHKRPQILINVPVNDVSEFASMTSLFEAADLYQKQLGDNGRILLRPSGTESCIRVMVEANDEGETRAIAEALAEIVRLH
ncbi:MAG: phosphoglucosamine mutase [Coxiellaceae bacterium]|nr:phosphoglucosamine mutase [Coxiellaceae bacterium]